jgi:hypothetical protein
MTEAGGEGEAPALVPASGPGRLELLVVWGRMRN